MEISIVIPAYNEEKRIKDSLLKIQEYLNGKKFKYEILVVDDGSKDNTIELVNSLKIKNLKVIKNIKNRGKGYSVKNGILNSKYSLVLFSDSDLATPIGELDEFLRIIQRGYDGVIASRNLKNSIITVKQSGLRQFLGNCFPFFVNRITGLKYKDTQCGFKLFKTEYAKKIVQIQTFERFSFDVEILFIAKKMNLKIKEAPVTWIDKQGSKVDPIKDSIKMGKDLLKIRINDLSGKYKIKHQ